MAATTIQKVLAKYERIAVGPGGGDGDEGGSPGSKSGPPFHHEFFEAMKAKGKTFVSPKTKNKIMFTSLPYEGSGGQKDLYTRWLHQKHSETSSKPQQYDDQHPAHAKWKEDWGEHGDTLQQLRHNTSHGEYTFHPKKGAGPLRYTPHGGKQQGLGQYSSLDHAKEAAGDHHTETMEKDTSKPSSKRGGKRRKGKLSHLDAGSKQTHRLLNDAIRSIPGLMHGPNDDESANTAASDIRHIIENEGPDDLHDYIKDLRPSDQKRIKDIAKQQGDPEVWGSPRMGRGAKFSSGLNMRTRR